MDSKPLTIEDALNAESVRRTKQAAVEARQAGVFSDLAMAWPKDRLFKSIRYSEFSQRTLGAVHITVEVDTRTEALDYFKSFKLEPLIYIKGTFTSIRAIDWITQEERDRAEIEQPDIWPMYWEWDDYWKAQLKSYVTLNGVRTSIYIKIKDDGAFRSVVRTTDRLESDKRITKWALHRAPLGEYVRYASGSPENAGNVIVYFPHEAGGAAPDPVHFMDGKQDIHWISSHWISNH